MFVISFSSKISRANLKIELKKKKVCSSFIRKTIRGFIVSGQLPLIQNLGFSFILPLIKPPISTPLCLTTLNSPHYVSPLTHPS